MNKVLGYSLLGVGLLGFLFFLKYKGTAIPLKELWFVLSICIVAAGSYFVVKYQIHQLTNPRNGRSPNRWAEIDLLKQTGEKVRITLDNAEVRTRVYQEEIVSDSIPSQSEMLDALYDSNRMYRTQEVQQTYILFYKQYGNKTYKFVSQATTQSADTLRLYIEQQKGIDLYIDPRRPSNFYFDLPFV